MPIQVFSPTPQPTAASMLGQAMGTGLAKRMGLSEAETAFSQAQGDPVKLATALARLTSVSPELERGAGQIYQALLNQTKNAQVAGGLSPRMGANPDTNGEIAPKGVVAPSPDVSSNVNPPFREIKTEKGPFDTERYSAEYLSAIRPDLNKMDSKYGWIPTFDFEFKSNLRPEEEGQLRQDLIDKGVRNPEAQDAIIEKIRGDVQSRYKEAFDRWDVNKQGQTMLNNKWQNFSTQAPEKLQPFLKPYSDQGLHATADDLSNKYFQYASKLPGNMTEEQMHTSAMANLQMDLNDINALKNIRSMPPIRLPKDAAENIDRIGELYRPLYERGYYNTLRENAFVFQDMGNEEFHASLFKDQTNKDHLNKLNQIKYPNRYVSTPQGQVKIPPNDKQRDAYRKTLSKELQKMKPEDDLILQRAMVMDSGGDIDDFQQALRMAQDGGLELSPFQQSQLTEVGIPRQPALWEIFSEEKPFGTEFTGAAGYMIQPFINYLRGKR